VNSAIEMTDVAWRAGGSFEVKDLSLRVPTGSIYGFLGPNGSGKTTTIRMFMGMLKPDRGTIRYDPAPPPAFTQTATYLLGDLEREYGAERFGRFWRSQDDVAEAFATAFGRPIGDWTAAWVAAHLGTVIPGPALPRQASFGTVLALLLGALAAGAWQRRRVGGR